MRKAFGWKRSMLEFGIPARIEELLEAMFFCGPWKGYVRKES
jgi:hypothetical protein